MEDQKRYKNNFYFVIRNRITVTDIENLKKDYHFRGHDADFSVGRRQKLRYAVKCLSVFLTQINSGGPEPIDYLKYAKSDLACKSDQGPINALSNAKRSVHLLIDTFLRMWSLDKLYSKSKFPEKLKLLSDLNALPVRMADMLNHKRNIIEHDYKSVTDKEAFDFVDVAEMLLLICQPYFRGAVVGAYVGIDDDNRCFEWCLKTRQNEVQVFEIKCDEFIETDFGRVHYNISENNERVLLSTVKVNKNNFDEWAPFLDLFMYLTKYENIRLMPVDKRGHGMFLMKYSHFVTSSE